MSIYTFSEERCIMCGEIIPEGRQVCLGCEWKALHGETPGAGYGEIIIPAKRQDIHICKRLRLLGKRPQYKASRWGLQWPIYRK